MKDFNLTIFVFQSQRLFNLRRNSTLKDHPPPKKNTTMAVPLAHPASWLWY